MRTLAVVPARGGSKRLPGKNLAVVGGLTLTRRALQTTAQILRGIRAALAENPGLTLDGILLTMVEPGNPTSERVAAYVREQLPPGLVLDMVVPRTHASIEAFAAGQPVVLRAPNDPAALAYRALADLLAGKLE